MDAASLPACASALAACLPVPPAWIAVDLRQAEIGPDSLALLALMRRYVERAGAQFVVVSTDPELVRILRDADVTGPYRIGSTLLRAIGAPAGPFRRRRTLRPGPPPASP
jgi:anti-anti-sigma regulatory factor